jgi:hypothetical protein
LKGTHDLLDDLGGGVEVDEALVHLELVAIPGLGTLTARGLTGGDPEDLGGETDGSLDLELLVLGTVDEVVRDCKDVIKVN